jgi:hypothetical protein
LSFFNGQIITYHCCKYRKLPDLLREAIMAQAMYMGSVATTTSMDKKTYAVNFKGLIAHLIDILFVDNKPATHYYSADLSSHIQRDIGLQR